MRKKKIDSVRIGCRSEQRWEHFVPSNKNKRCTYLLIAGCVLSLLVGCHTQQPETNRTAAGAASDKHAQATLYTIDPQQSAITLKVYRDGPLARFGHNHVITATEIAGTIYREKNPLQSDVELSIPAHGLQVDRAEERAMAGADFPGTLPPEAIAGTRQNMLGPKLLAAEQFPRIELRTVAVSGQWPALQLLVEVKLREFTRSISIPVRVSENGNTLIAEGGLTISQAALGLSPYSVLGGGLRVRDTIDAAFHLVANKNVVKN